MICPLSFGIGRCAVVFAAYVSHARPDLNYGHHQGVLRALFVRDPLKFKKRGQFFMGVPSGVTGKEERRELPTRRSLVQGTTHVFSLAPGISLCLAKDSASRVRRPSKDKIMKLLLFAAGLLNLMGVARGSDEKQLVR